MGHSFAALISFVTWTKVYCCLLGNGALYSCSHRDRQSSKTEHKVEKTESRTWIISQLKSPFLSQIQNVGDTTASILLAPFFSCQRLCRAGELYENDLSCVSRSPQAASLCVAGVDHSGFQHCSHDVRLLYQRLPKSLLNTINQLCLHIPQGSQSFWLAERRNGRRTFIFQMKNLIKLISV